MSDYLTMAELDNMTLKEIYNYARDFKISYYSQMNKKELSLAVIRAQAEKQGFFYMEGILDIISQDSYGFLRPINYGPSAEDIYISNSQIRRFSLRNGDKVAGKARPPKESERYYGLMHVESVNGKNPEEAKKRPHFPALTALYPETPFTLETTPGRISTRIMDLFSPVGFGQRGLIVAPPKAGKTSIIKEVANGITENYPDVELIVLLIDERPEEVTDLERSVDGEVVYSTFDLQPNNHTRVSELVLERAMRLVEDKRDVVILMDSITRLARAYNLVVPPSGRTLSGGIDPAALYKPKKFFGAARNIEEGGSLTVLATALVDTGSRMDDVIYEEFKGTGNMEMHLSRQLAERRVFPAIDLKRSSTRKEELLMSPEQLEETWRLRNNMLGDSLENTEQFISFLKKTKTNQEFLDSFHDVSFTDKKSKRSNKR
ncbi:transcription termination factor Rho [Tetragenococcus halophilus subsp. halophilus]|uniref:Transcription termination factor Rho n=1 Tax=Tetragenococcus halophilus (strain DSM 20338 / JCM 20259 / NCIMB 9735 / NBRC 12172) TaxID=945021 RepID=A0AAN1SGV2_TETHN|nr:transcription termination factor Rho [Tetragenococcus halophilus]AOF48502.1 transcription termination factor Rho [Tetragenococcus halophilus]MCO8286059.1 transcription termination factor Rho [Tetragenococcus halophilus]NWN99733.1 transcription termination factor Rho [Tetragenococcus halophilus]WJS81266.1 transcription termination factor Rho [Tetragenococcus halophilus]BAK94316.1 transcription termination factor Rho [Tetragenococcus halophilus NBRC 12172]